jgi:membrane protein DedA with SNARE-associated domain
MDFSHITELILHYRYFILFPLACFEGPVISFVVGILAAAGYFNPINAYVVLIFGDIIPDIAYYFLGRYGEHKAIVARYISKIGVTEKHFDVIRKLWHTHTGKTMFFGKLAYGLSTPFLVSAGLVGMSLKKFLAYALPITLVQYAFLLALGYYFGGSFNFISTSLRDVQIIIAAVLVVALGYYFFTRYMRSKLLQEEKKEELS